MTTLEIINLQKSFGEKKVLNGISFTAKTGAAFGLLGRNGAGKTTTIRIIMGVFLADSGQVLLNGGPIDRHSVSIGYLPEERGLYPKRKILEQLIYLGQLKGLAKAAASKSARHWLEKLEMDEYSDKMLDTLSKGNQQKIQLASCLLGDPDIVILDEPFSGLDPVNAQMFKNAVSELVVADKLVIFSSHQMSQVESFCDRIAIIEKGDIILEDSISSVKRGYPRTKLLITPDYRVYGDNFMGILKPICGSLKENNAIVNYEASSNGVLLNLHDEKDKSAVMDLLTQNGIELERFEVIEPSLEYIFVDKVGKYNDGE